MKTLYENSIVSLVGFAARARKLVQGFTSVERSVKRKNAKLVILDPQAGETTKKRIEALCSRVGVPVVFLPKGFSMEDILGKPNCRCAGVTDSGFSEAILQRTKESQCK
ncbi:MAG: ribosomal L7Ae/L30e/S12e/Gadd45 family protein [bacterium]